MIRMSNSLDPDQAGHFVEPDLDPNCLQKFSSDETIKRPRVRAAQHDSVCLLE